MSQLARLNALLELVNSRGSIASADIGQELGISEATTRRYLQTLEEQQLLTRTRGGAIARGSGLEWPLQARASRRTSEKRSIARAAAQFVTHGDIVGLNGGTTTSEVAREISQFAGTAGDGASCVTVVTTAINIAYELAVRPEIKVVLTGGVARHTSMEMIGPLADRALSSVTLDLAVVGVDGVDARFGVTTAHDLEASILQTMLGRAKRRIVVADATKLGRAAFAHVCDFERVDVLVTDGELPAGLEATLRTTGTQVVIATS